MGHHIYFIEHLSIYNWLFSIFPCLLRDRNRNSLYRNDCYVIGGSLLSYVIALWTSKLLGVDLARFTFRLLDVQDKNGLLLRLRVVHSDLFQVQNYLVSDPDFKTLLGSGLLKSRMARFLLKRAIGGPIDRAGSLWRSTFLVQVCRWKADMINISSQDTTLFLGKRVWFESVREYGNQYGVTVIPVRAVYTFKSYLRTWMPGFVVELLRFARNRFLRPLVSSNTSDVDDQAEEVSSEKSGAELQERSALSYYDVQDHFRIAAEVYGQFNLDKPELHSDLFFWHGSSLKAEDLLLTFSVPTDYLDRSKYKTLQRHGMLAVALGAGLTSVKEIPTFVRSRKSVGSLGDLSQALKGNKNTSEETFLLNNLAEYHSIYDYWTNSIINT